MFSAQTTIMMIWIMMVTLPQNSLLRIKYNSVMNRLGLVLNVLFLPVSIPLSVVGSMLFSILVGIEKAIK